MKQHTNRRRPGAGRPPLDAPPTIYHITLRLYPGADDDLRAWLESVPQRYRASAVKSRLLTGRAPAMAIVTGPTDDDLDAALSGLILC